MGSHDLRLKKVEDDDAEDFVDECNALAARLQSKQYVYPLSQTRNPHVHPGRKHPDGASTGSCCGG